MEEVRRIGNLVIDELVGNGLMVLEMVLGNLDFRAEPGGRFGRLPKATEYATG